MSHPPTEPAPANKARILFASLIGTTIEFFDFYIYATAAVLVFPDLFFPEADPASATLQSLATFALAFFARPVGSALFGHFGDRVGRKATLVAALMTEAQFAAWGWRVPFLASSLLVFVGLWVRLHIKETPAFQQALDNHEREKVPMLTVFREHAGVLCAGTFGALATFVLFYLMTVFALSWGTSALGFDRQDFLWMEIIGVLFFALTIPISAVAADRYGQRRTLITVTLAIIAFGLLFAPLFGSGSTLGVLVFLCVGLALMGLTYGPIGTALAELFPTAVRYTGASLAFNLAGIFGASLAPYIATWLATSYGIASVGFYMSAAGVITLVALIARPADAPDDAQTAEAAT
jgi:MFS family permease